jgi:3-hydroxymyristoyl/3-hydroxydecanoyl-(acyl carrier protein) dehydratase
MWHEAALHFAAGHPSVAGHFPGYPIVPGALILDEVVMAIAGATYNGHVVIRSAKFLAPVIPGDSVTLRWQTLANGSVAFECRREGSETLAVTGTLDVNS